MRAVRRSASIRLLVAALAVWLAADTLTHGACAHDLIAYTHGVRTEVSGDPSPVRSHEAGDPTHCSCHWQYLPEPALLPVECEVWIPVACEATAWIPEAAARVLDRPPQGT